MTMLEGPRWKSFTKHILDVTLPKKVSGFCAMKVGIVRFWDTLLTVYATLLCHILDHMFTPHIHGVRK
jgi:hypothetical protein